MGIFGRGTVFVKVDRSGRLEICLSVFCWFQNELQRIAQSVSDMESKMNSWNRGNGEQTSELESVIAAEIKTRYVIQVISNFLPIYNIYH